MEVHLVTDDGKRLDALLTITEGTIILHSRGGAKNASNASNTEYGPALRLLLDRLARHGVRPDCIYVDSSRVQHLSIAERTVWNHKDGGISSDTATLIGRRMQAIGRSPTSKSLGNSNKRLALAIPIGPVSEIAKVINATPAHFSELRYFPISENTVANSVREPESAPFVPLLSDSDKEWAEGNLKLVNHLARERSPAAANAKRNEFISQHGKLFCEWCQLDPVATYGPNGVACIEIHHANHAVADMENGHTTKTADLQCLCANCHRFIHRKMKAKHSD